ncbi:MAG: flagellar export protein FliJ [Nitrospira sp.]|nr:flagellar export protein FliJ [Nitrospira sp.]
MSVQALQHYRLQVEEQIKMELAEVTQQLLQAEQSIARLADDRQRQEEQYREETRRGMTIEQLLQWQSHFEAQASAAEQARRTLAHWQLQWEEARARLVAASQDRRTLDRLIARYREAALIEMRRREQMATDESAHHRFTGQGDARS